MIETTTVRQIDAVTRNLNIWASIAHHELAGAMGCPSIERCGIRESLSADPPHPDELPPQREGVLTWDLTRADDLYEASFRKYNPTGAVGYPNDPKSQLHGLMVECELRTIGYPLLLVGLLLWLYPTCGELAPRRPNAWDPENPYRSFRPRKWVAQTCGTLGEKYHEQSIDRLLKSIESAFRRQLSERITPPRRKQS